VAKDCVLEQLSAVLIFLGRRAYPRVTMLALLLENLGADRAVRLGNPAVWRAAVTALGGLPEGEAGS
jgi:hypothetical protein